MDNLVEKVKSLDAKERQQSISWVDRIERLEVKKNSLWCVAPLISIDIYWRQRARQHWIVDGDPNTKFFHQVANMRRKFNAIYKIKVDGEPC